MFMRSTGRPPIQCIDIYLLTSQDGRGYQGRLLHKWDINACPMSSMDFAENGKILVAAWETGVAAADKDREPPDG